ncbi:MAG: T9SS type A sorting domain-containing protein [Bacteroidetes bacterium]|nr:T9SS type A sorting domain-containing protein [Bacteroidota bacterium]
MSLSLWPNPANETITIRSAGLLQESKLRIFDTVGKLVSPETLLPPSASGTTIDISALVPGVYMVELQTTTQIKTQRLIVY